MHPLAVVAPSVTPSAQSLNSIVVLSQRCLFMPPVHSSNKIPIPLRGERARPKVTPHTGWPRRTRRVASGYRRDALAAVSRFLILSRAGTMGQGRASLVPAALLASSTFSPVHRGHATAHQCRGRVRGGVHACARERAVRVALPGESIASVWDPHAAHGDASPRAA